MTEEDNLLAAWRLARQHGWWPRVISAMQGLRALYEETGRGPAWQRLVGAVTPDFVDLRTDRPLPGRQEQWSLVTEYRVRIAAEERDLDKAGRLLRLRIDWNRKRAREALAAAPERRSDDQRNDIRSLGASIHELGEIQRANNDAACASSYSEAFSLLQSIGDRAGQAACAANLGVAYMDVAGLQDLDKANVWSQKSLDLRPPGDALGRGKSLGQLGKVALVRFDDASEKERSEEERLRFLNEAVRYYLEALELFPATSIVERGVSHNALGAIFGRAGDIDRALHHYQQDIRYSEQAGNIFGAGTTRFNVAVDLVNAGRFDDARAYAKAALANFQSFGGRAAEDIQKAEGLLAAIDQAEAKQRGKS
jgi:tetratricopeptide (TPR) repeat protein